MTDLNEVQLKFADEPARSWLNGDSNVTLRIGDEKGITAGTNLVMTTTGSIPFGRGRVKLVSRVPLFGVTEVIRGHDLKYPIVDDPDAILASMKGYYPDSEVTLDTPVKLIHIPDPTFRGPESLPSTIRPSGDYPR